MFAVSVQELLLDNPFAVFGILMFSSPAFYGAVIGERPIQIGLTGLGVWMFIGNMVMRRMIDLRL